MARGLQPGTRDQTTRAPGAGKSRAEQSVPQRRVWSRYSGAGYKGERKGRFSCPRDGVPAGARGRRMPETAQRGPGGEPVASFVLGEGQLVRRPSGGRSACTHWPGWAELRWGGSVPLPGVTSRTVAAAEQAGQSPGFCPKDKTQITRLRNRHKSATLPQFPKPFPNHSPVWASSHEAFDFRGKLRSGGRVSRPGPAADGFQQASHAQPRLLKDRPPLCSRASALRAPAASSGKGGSLWRSGCGRQWKGVWGEKPQEEEGATPTAKRMDHRETLGRGRQRGLGRSTGNDP